MAQAAPTRRTASPEKWAASLARAHAAGLVAYNVAGDPRHWFVTSGSTPGAGYLVAVHAGETPTCFCKGAEFHDYCQHRALVLDRLGLLPRPRPEIVAAPVPAIAALKDRGRQALRDLYGDDAA